MGFDYTSSQWRAVAELAKARDGHRCTVGRFLGGRCSPLLHAHHLTPVSEGGAPYDVDNIASCCSVHHPQVEAIRRAVLHRRDQHAIRCRHIHRYKEGREECLRRRMARAALR